MKIKRHKSWNSSIPLGPFIADINTCDIPETICAMIRNAPPNCVAVTLKPMSGNGKMIQLAEHAARKKGIRIIWRPIGPRTKEDT